MTIITLASGLPFDLSAPESSVTNVTIRDVAHSLSHICRFNGHTRDHYSVAQHSLFVSSLLPPQLQLQGLLHDAAEIIVGDMASTLKAMFPEYKVYEKRVEAALLRHFNLPYPLDPRVKEADTWALVYEYNILMTAQHLDHGPYASVEPPQWVWERIPLPMSPETVRTHFLGAYALLTDALL